MLNSSKEIVVVCIGSHPQTTRLLRAAQRKAAQLGCGWMALIVQTPAYLREDPARRSRTLRFAEQAETRGALLRLCEARDVESGITRTVSDGAYERVHLYIGTSDNRRLGGFLSPRVARRVRSRLPNHVELYVLPLIQEGLTGGWQDILQIRNIRWREIPEALLLVLGAFLIGELAREVMSAAEFRLNYHNIELLFIIPIVFVAGRSGLAAGMMTAVVSFLVVHYFHLAPYYTLSFAAKADLVNLVLFLCIAVVVALFGSYTHAHAEAAQRRERRIQSVFKLSNVAAAAHDRQDALELLQSELNTLLEMPVAFFLPPVLNPDRIEQVRPVEPIVFSDYEREALEQCWNNAVNTGAYSTRNGLSEWRFEPMVTAQGVIGVVGLQINKSHGVDLPMLQLLAALCDQCASVLERLELSRDLELKRISEEREKLRSLLLSSVSHDLKTPLASIIGSLSVYHGMYHSLPEDKRMELTETALDEAQRLDSFITNILDMTRIESGRIKLRKEWHEPKQILNSVVKRLKQRLRHHTVNIMALESAVEVEMDSMLTEQVLQNLLDNAAKYTPASAMIDVIMQTEGDRFLLSIRDYGKGIPEDQKDRVFDKYERLNHRDSKVAGTGLGLAISRAIMQAQDGTVDVQNHPDGGAIFTLTFNSWRVLDGNQETPSERQKQERRIGV